MTNCSPYRFQVQPHGPPKAEIFNYQFSMKMTVEIWLQENVSRSNGYLTFFGKNFNVLYLY